MIGEFKTVPVSKPMLIQSKESIQIVEVLTKLPMILFYFLSKVLFMINKDLKMLLSFMYFIAPKLIYWVWMEKLVILLLLWASLFIHFWSHMT